MTTGQVIISRRAIMTGLTSGAGLLLAGCPDTQPPNYGNVLRMADNLTYRAQRLLLPRQALAREYDRRDITSIPAIGTTDPADPHGEFYDAAYVRGRLVGDCRMDGSAIAPRARSRGC